MPNEKHLMEAIFAEARPCRHFIEVNGAIISLEEAIQKSLESLPIFPRRPGQRIPEDSRRRTIELRFGLIDGKPKKRAEIGRELGGVTEERIREIEVRALRLLRHPTRSELLERFLVPSPE